MPFQPYAVAHSDIEGPGDARPTALQIVQDCKAVDSLKGKHILITGCSGGLGAETARALYETGAQLWLTARDMTKLNGVIDDIVDAASSGSDKALPRPEAVEMHLDALASVKQAAEAVLAKTDGKLDMLILNAGVMAGPLGYTSDGFEKQIAVNHLAGFLLFHLVRSALETTAQERGRPSRVVILSSAGHAWSPLRLWDLNWKEFPMTYNQWQAYGSSKTANIYTARAIDRKFQPHIRAWSVHPGGIATDLGRNLGEADYAGFGDVSKIFATYKSPQQGAATTVWTALEPKAEEIGGTYIADCGETTPRKSGDVVSAGGYAEHAYDEEMEERLWEMSLGLVKDHLVEGQPQ